MTGCDCQRHIILPDVWLQMDGWIYAIIIQVWFSQDSLWERHKKWSERGVWKRIMDSLVSHGYHTGLVDMQMTYQ